MLQYFGDPEEAGMLMTPEQARALLCNVSRRYLDWLVETMQLPCVTIGVSQVRFRTDVVEDFLNRNWQQLRQRFLAEREAANCG